MPPYRSDNNPAPFMAAIMLFGSLNEKVKAACGRPLPLTENNSYVKDWPPVCVPAGHWPNLVTVRGERHPDFKDGPHDCRHQLLKPMAGCLA
jgi:hypothetical protein